MSNPSGSSNVGWVRVGRSIKTLFTRAVASLAWKLSALGVGFHVIVAGRRVRVAVANHSHQDKTTLPYLNDDCIHEILSMKCLSVVDLCSAAESCHRLKEIASRVFSREHNACEIYSLSNGETKTAKRILMHFGLAIRHLQITRGNEELSTEILESVAEYCSDTLQSLDLKLLSIDIPENLTAELRQLFKNLQKLTIRNCNFVGASRELFAVCGSLVALNVSHYARDAFTFILEKTFPKLQQFEYYLAAESDLMEPFISRHMNLKSLKIRYSAESSVLLLIADCTQLETLSCYIPENSTLDLSNLGHLKELNIGCNWQSVSEAVMGLKHLQLLEDLTLKGSEIDPEFIGTLSQLKRLRALNLSWSTGLQNLHQIGDLCQLTTLKIHSWKYVDLDVARLVERLSKLVYVKVAVLGLIVDMEKSRRIVDVVRRRSDKSELIFDCDNGKLRPVYV